ncbi:hypothetical protein M0812_08936 [Anaeramoeba flamelloides]|uniref:Uncharacterized protein n=1 Tax=Anaeramoeba flamelloides TaxID=1746091 RepID=A0AAV7ZP72_9EUKA|nr:hypothetical protein M0812_08936 [Anaeramoeba flamelloides]
MFMNKKILARLYRSLVKHGKKVAEKSLWSSITRISTVANFLSMGKRMRVFNDNKIKSLRWINYTALFRLNKVVNSSTLPNPKSYSIILKYDQKHTHTQTKTTTMLVIMAAREGWQHWQ